MATADLASSAVTALNGVRAERGGVDVGPDRGALRLPLPGVRPHSLGLRTSRRAPRSRSRSCDPTRARRSSSSPRRSPAASPNQRKGGRDDVASLVPHRRPDGPRRTAGPERTAGHRRRSRASSPALPSGRCSLPSPACSSRRPCGRSSSHSGNYHHASMGRRGTLISALAAFLVGAAPAIVAFFEDLGRTVK